VPRFWTRLCCCLGCWVLLSVVGRAAEPQSRPSETLLPETTQGFFAIWNVDALSQHWQDTQLGHLMADPVMEPFTKDVRRQIEERWSSIHQRLGITLEDMKEVPGGDAAIGLIAPGPGQAALAIVVDVSGKLPQANEMLQKVTAAQLRRGAKRSELAVEGRPEVIVQFDLPQLDEDKEAGQSELAGIEKTTTKEQPEVEPPAVRRAYYCVTGNLLVITDHLEVMQGILGRAAGHQNGSLANYKPFQMVVARCRSDYGDATPQIRWYIHPLGYAEAARAATPTDRRRKGKSILEVMRNQGVGAIQAVGGFVDFSAEGHEMIHRTAVYAPPPYEKAMKMLVMPNRPDLAPQSWAPRDIATYTTFYFDIQNAFQHFGSLFDELFGQGESGVWEEVKMSLRDDPNGPQIDLHKDLIQHLGSRISVLTDYQLPITTASERLMFAIETGNSEAVAKAIEKLMKNDPTAKRREREGLVIWEIVEDDAPMPEAPEITFGDVPAVAPAQPLKKRRKLVANDDEEEDEERRLLPHAAITVWQGNLMIASHIDFLLKVIAPAEKPDLLKDDVDYQLVDEVIGRQEPKEKCLRAFSRTDEEYRPAYELIRQNKMPESEGMMGRLLNALFGEGKKDGRAQKIDGSQLPDYQVVRRYLNPAGLQVTSEPEGWYIKGFTLTRAEEEAPPAEEKAASEEKTLPVVDAEKKQAENPAPEAADDQS